MNLEKNSGASTTQLREGKGHRTTLAVAYNVTVMVCNYNFLFGIHVTFRASATGNRFK